MEKITKYYKYSYENDTTIEYVSTGLYSMLNCSYTSEDPDYGTDTVHFTAKPSTSMEMMAYNMLKEVKLYLDWKDGTSFGIPCEIENAYSDYSNSTLIAIEYALYEITKNFRPKKWYATVKEASRMIADRLLENRKLTFAFCESDPDEAMGDPEKHEESGGWHGIKRIDGFFDNEPSEFIVAIGHYGGGNVGFVYVDRDSADDSTCEDELASSIIRATGWNYGTYIYVEEEEE